jgi:hypothetical protein
MAVACTIVWAVVSIWWLVVLGRYGTLYRNTMTVNQPSVPARCPSPALTPRMISSDRAIGRDGDRIGSDVDRVVQLDGSSTADPRDAGALACWQSPRGVGAQQAGHE